MRAEFDTEAFDAGIRRLLEDVDEASRAAVEDGMEAVEAEFRARAVVMDGDYRDSFVRLTPNQESDGRWSVAGGPGVVYSRRLERRYGAVESSFTEARTGDAMSDRWGRAVS